MASFGELSFGKQRALLLKATGLGAGALSLALLLPPPVFAAPRHEEAPQLPAYQRVLGLEDQIQARFLALNAITGTAPVSVVSLAQENPFLSTGRLNGQTITPVAEYPLSSGDVNCTPLTVDFDPYGDNTLLALQAQIPDQTPTYVVTRISNAGETQIVSTSQDRIPTHVSAIPTNNTIEAGHIVVSRPADPNKPEVLTTQVVIGTRSYDLDFGTDPALPRMPFMPYHPKAIVDEQGDTYIFAPQFASHSSEIRAFSISHTGEVAHFQVPESFQGSQIQVLGNIVAAHAVKGAAHTVSVLTFHNGTQTLTSQTWEATNPHDQCVLIGVCSMNGIDGPVSITRETDISRGLEVVMARFSKGTQQLFTHPLEGFSGHFPHEKIFQTSPGSSPIIATRLTDNRHAQSMNVVLAPTS